MLIITGILAIALLAFGNNKMYDNIICKNIKFALSIAASIAAVLGIYSLVIASFQYSESQLTEDKQMVEESEILIKHFKYIIDNYIPEIDSAEHLEYQKQINSVCKQLSVKSNMLLDSQKYNLRRNAQIIILSKLSSVSIKSQDSKIKNLQIIKEGFSELEYWCNSANEKIRFGLVDMNNLFMELYNLNFMKFLSRYESVFRSFGIDRYYDSCLELLDTWKYYYNNN